MSVNIFVLLCVLSLTLFSVDCKIPSGRCKRIIYGLPITARDSPYDVVRYTVFIAMSNVCSKGFLDYWPYFLPIDKFLHIDIDRLKYCTPDEYGLSCGGALLTPKIVHTACHCLADYVPRPGTNMSYAVVQNVIEKSYKIYPGQADTSSMVQYVEPKKYFVYERCATLAKGDIIHDFGIIVLHQELDWPMYQELEINYVPTPPVKKIEELYYKVLNEESTCLLVGWGSQRMTEYGGAEDSPSSVLLHGWQTITSYNTCKNYVYFKRIEKAYRETHPDFEYDRDSTWACTVSVLNKSLSRFDSLYSAGSGDSGSPVACYNEYFAVISNSVTPKYFEFGGKATQAQQAVTLVSPVAFSYFEVASEHRKLFVEAIQFWKDVAEKSINVTKPPHDKFRNGSLSTTNSFSFSSLLLFIFYFSKAITGFFLIDL